MYGGVGFVVGVNGSGMSATFTVKYNDPSGKTTERNIGYNCLTALPLHYVNSNSRPKRNNVTVQNVANIIPPLPALKDD